MNQKQLFECVVMIDKYEETEKGSIYKDTEIVIQPKFVLAKDQKEVLFKLTREIPEEYADHPDNVRIYVRNF
jgi:hypothetical protein